MMDLRIASYRDCETIARLHVASWRSSYNDILSPAYLAGPIEDDRFLFWQTRLNDPHPAQYVLIGELNGEAAAFSCTMANHDPQWGALVDNIHVLPGEKRRGLGRKLLRSTAEWLGREFPRQPMHLWVFEANESAQRFYDAMGGQVTERRLLPTPDGGEASNLRYCWVDPTILVC